MKLFGQMTSGNCWKIRLMLGFLGQAYEYQSLDSVGGETRQDWYLSINPAGKIPCLVLDDGETLIESNAILWRLGQGTEYWPQGIEEQTRVMSWLFWEQYSHEPALAVARAWKIYRDWDQEKPEEFAALQEKSIEALKLMEMQLTYSKWLATDAPTIADISLFPYTALVGEANVDLDPFPGVRAWIERFKALPGFRGLGELGA